MRTTKQGRFGLERSKVDAVLPQLDTVIPKNEFVRQNWSSIYHWVASSYIPHPYPGKITFFWTDEELFRREGDGVN